MSNSPMRNTHADTAQGTENDVKFWIIGQRKGSIGWVLACYQASVVLLLFLAGKKEKVCPAWVLSTSSLAISRRW